MTDVSGDDVSIQGNRHLDPHDAVAVVHDRMRDGMSVADRNARKHSEQHSDEQNDDCGNVSHELSLTHSVNTFNAGLDLPPRG